MRCSFINACLIVQIKSNNHRYGRNISVSVIGNLETNDATTMNNVYLALSMKLHRSRRKTM